MAETTGRGRALGIAGIAVSAPLLVLMGVWAALVIYYARLPLSILSPLGALLFAAASVVAFAKLGRRALPWFLGAWLLILVAFLLKSPSNDRDWPAGVAALAQAEFDGDKVTIRSIRNFDYRSARDFDVRHTERTFDLRKLKTADLAVCYWGELEAVAHTLLSFGFEGGEQLAISIEIRREKGEIYDPVAGLFKRFEIIYVVGDERDLLRLRTNHRGERVYLFPLATRPDENRKLLRSMLERVNQLVEKPAFYHTLGQNCTTAIVDHINAIWPGRVPFTRKILMNGYLPEQAYERGTIPHDLPFEEMKRRHFVSEIAKRYESDLDFSRRIRSHLP
jgi:hypothetical protein